MFSQCIIFGLFMLWHQHKFNLRRWENLENFKTKASDHPFDLKLSADNLISSDTTAPKSARHTVGESSNFSEIRKKIIFTSVKTYFYFVCLFEWKTGKSFLNNKFVMIPKWLYRFFTAFSLHKASKREQNLLASSCSLVIRSFLSPKTTTSDSLGHRRMMMSKKREEIFPQENKLLIKIVSLLIFPTFPATVGISECSESLRMYIKHQRDENKREIGGLIVREFIMRYYGVHWKRPSNRIIRKNYRLLKK